MTIAGVARCFVSRKLPGTAVDRLAEVHDVDLWPDSLPPAREELLARVREAEGLLSMLTDRVDDELLDAEAGDDVRLDRQRGEELRRRVGRHDGPRVWVEGEDRVGVPDDGPVAEVDAVKIAHRHDCPLRNRGRGRGVADNNEARRHFRGSSAQFGWGRGP